MVPSHMGEWRPEGWAFLGSAVLQLGLAVGLVLRPRRWMAAVALVSSAAFIFSWWFTRYAGMPFGPSEHYLEDPGTVDVTCVVLEAGGHRRRHRHPGAAPPQRRWKAPVLVFASLIPLAAIIAGTLAVASPEAAAHGGHADGAAHGKDDLGLWKLSNGHHHAITNNALDPATQAEHDRQIAITREVAAQYPTVASAEAAGYRKAGPYSPGLGSHYTKTGGNELNADGIVDDEDLRHPLSIIYDGNEPDSPVAGFMYYSISSIEPAGFAGTNDTWHTHSNVCIKPMPDGSVDSPFGADLPIDEPLLPGGRGHPAATPPSGWSTCGPCPGYDNVKGGVFAEVNPALACSDGTYFRLDPDRVGPEPHERLLVEGPGRAPLPGLSTSRGGRARPGRTGRPDPRPRCRRGRPQPSAARAARGSRRPRRSVATATPEAVAHGHGLVDELDVARGAVAGEELEAEVDVAAPLDGVLGQAGLDDVAADHRHRPRHRAVAERLEVGVEGQAGGRQAEGGTHVAPVGGQVELDHRAGRQGARPPVGDGGPQEAGLVDGEARPDAVGGGPGELLGDGVEAVGVDEAAARDAVARRRRPGSPSPGRTGSTRSFPVSASRRQVVEVEGPVDGVGRGVDERVGPGLQHRGPRRQVLVGDEAGVAVDGDVVVHDGGAGLETGQRVGGDLVGRAGHVRIGGLLGDPVDGRFDDDWSPIHGGTLGGPAGTRGENAGAGSGGEPAPVRGWRWGGPISTALKRGPWRGDPRWASSYVDLSVQARRPIGPTVVCDTCHHDQRWTCASSTPCSPWSTTAASPPPPAPCTPCSPTCRPTSPAWRRSSA